MLSHRCLFFNNVSGRSLCPPIHLRKHVPDITTIRYVCCERQVPVSRASRGFYSLVLIMYPEQLLLIARIFQRTCEYDLASTPSELMNDCDPDMCIDPRERMVSRIDRQRDLYHYPEYAGLVQGACLPRYCSMVLRLVVQGKERSAQLPSQPHTTHSPLQTPR